MLDHSTILQHIDDIFGQDMHAKRVLSLANATHGVIESGSLAIHAIGCGLSAVRSVTRKHAVKQIDLLLTNTKLNVWKLFHDWVPYVVGERTEIVVSMACCSEVSFCTMTRIAVPLHWWCICTAIRKMLRAVGTTLRKSILRLGKSTSTVERAASALVKAGRLRFVGSRKSGHWEVTPRTAAPAPGSRGSRRRSACKILGTLPLQVFLVLAQTEVGGGSDIVRAKQLMQMIPLPEHGHELRHRLGWAHRQQQEARVPIGGRHPKLLGETQHQSSSSRACNGCLSFSPSVRFTWLRHE